MELTRTHAIGEKTASPGAVQVSGFSMIEVCMVVMIFSVIAGFAVLNVTAFLPGMHANQTMNQTVAQLRAGRNMAISQRRGIQLLFAGDSTVSLVRNEYDQSSTELKTVSFGNGFEFMLFDGISDTPDGFGNSEAIDFPGAAFFTFLPDGTLVDQSGNPVNGTVFLGKEGRSETARAVTVLGATGRIRGYRWTGTSWIK
jgi:prepilin-type N-terminal cleavage/methylation domain-containing protein